MPWVQRGNKRYFYRSERIKGRPTRRYLGSGETAEQVAEEIENRSLERRVRAENLRAQDEAYAAATVPLDQLCNLTDLLLRATLISQGFHQHTRGAWRRKRHVQDDPGTAVRQELPPQSAGNPATGRGG